VTDSLRESGPLLDAVWERSLAPAGKARGFGMTPVFIAPVEHPRFVKIPMSRKGGETRGAPLHFVGGRMRPPPHFSTDPLKRPGAQEFFSVRWGGDFRGEHLIEFGDALCVLCRAVD
jgi:hypothetical protein